PWLSDGTPAGTGPIADLAPGAMGSRPDWLTVAGGRLFFGADDGTQGRELWSTDGTAAGTLRVAELVPGLRGGDVNHLHPAGDGRRVLFSAAEPGAGREPWTS